MCCSHLLVSNLNTIREGGHTLLELKYKQGLIQDISIQLLEYSSFQRVVAGDVDLHKKAQNGEYENMTPGLTLFVDLFMKKGGLVLVYRRL